MLVLPLGITWFAAVLLALADGRRRPVAWAAVGAIAASLAATVWLAIAVIQDGPIQQVAGGWQVGVGIRLRADALGVTFALLSTSVMLVAMLYEALGRVRSRSFPALACFMVTGLTGLFLTGDAFNFYVFFEIAMISAYVMTSYGERTRQLRAATIFLTVNLLGSVLFLIAIAGLYHLTGTLDMQQMAGRIIIVEEQPTIVLATLIFVAFCVKLGLFPFHFWLPAVYTGTRPAVAAILAGALANIGSFGLLRFGGVILPRELEFGATVILILGSVSIIYGAVQAISCGTPSEVLAYSSIGQVGYILIALGLGGEAGFTAAVLYTIVNALNKTLLFLAIPLRGYLVGAAITIGVFSVTGIPPAAGFFGKAGVFRAGIADDEPLLLALMFVGSALSFVYMFQFHNRGFWVVPEPEATATEADGEARRAEPALASIASRRALVFGVAAMVLFFGIWPEPILTLSEQAAAALPATR